MLRNNFRLKPNVVIPSVWEEIAPSIGTGVGVALLLYLADPPLWLVPIVLVALFVSLNLFAGMISERRSKRR